MRESPPGGRIPTPEECQRILETQDVPPHIRRHSEQVARIARRLAESLRDNGGEAVDVAAVEAAALLHDIAKARCLVTRGDHAAEGGELLRGLGLPEIASLVERHVALGVWERGGPVVEAEILNYADKRVLHEDVVSLAERYQDLITRYSQGVPLAEARIRDGWRATEALEQKIFARLPFGPEQLEA